MQRNYNEVAFSVHTEVLIFMQSGSAPAALLPVTSAFPSGSWWVKQVLLLGENASLRAEAVGMGFKGTCKAGQTQGGVGGDTHKDGHSGVTCRWTLH